ncbi:MAG TPA: SigE family RNA polymerase sigma factor [Streptosporangiaceae bacterium]|jgi:RNA polymerase sigma-70 factor (sigma-E family)
MDFNDRGVVDEIHSPGALRRPRDAEAAVEALYQGYAPGLIRLAYVMLGDRPAAEDVVQEAFCGLYRRWQYLAGPDRALSYVRSAVLNGCRSTVRRQAVRRALVIFQPHAASAEALVLSGEERQEVMHAVRRLPARQREVLVLRFYLDLPDDEIARTMNIQPSTVRSAAARALETLGRALKEPS